MTIPIKTKPLISLLLLTISSLTLANVTVDRDVKLGGDGSDFGYDIRPTSDDGYIAVGVDGEGNLLRYFVTKLDASGVPSWQRTLALGNISEKAFSVQETADGGFIVIGSALISRTGAPGTVNRPWLLKLAANGDVVWDSRNGFTQSLDVNSGIIVGTVLSNGQIVVAGGTNTTTSFQDAWILRVDGDGQLLDFQSYAPFIQGFGQGTYINQVEATSDGGFVVAGSAGPPLGQAFLWKFDNAGAQEWVRLYPIQDGGFPRINGVRNAIGGGYLLTGCGGVNCTEALLAQTDASGQLSWLRTYPDPGRDYTEARDVLQRGNGSLTLLQTRVSAFGSTRINSDLLHLANDGTLLGTQNLVAGSDATSLTRLVNGAGDQVAAAGYSRDGTDYDFLVVIGRAIFNPNNLTPNASDDQFVGEEDTLLEIAAPGVLANDSDPDGDALGAQLVQAPNHGDLTLYPDGSLEYWPRTGFAGQDSFTYRVVDGQALGNLATVTITVPDTIQHPPHIEGDQYRTYLDENLVVRMPGVLQNDVDVDGDALTATLVQSTTNGTLVFNSDGSFLYNPAPGFSGNDSFTYTVSDGFISSAAATVVIEVGPFNGLSLDWSREWGADRSDYLNDVSPTRGGGFLAVGVLGDGYQNSGFAEKTDSLGQSQWRYRTSLDGIGTKVYRGEQTQDGGLILIGATRPPGLYDFRPFLIKLDINGGELWSTANGLTQQIEVDSAIVVGAELRNGTFAIAGGTNTVTSFQEPWLALVASDGSLLSFQPLPIATPGFGQGTYINDLVATRDGGFALAGSDGGSTGRGMLWKFDSSGTQEWQQIYPADANGFRVAQTVRTAMDGGFLLAGCGAVNCTESLAARTDALGNLIWVETYSVDDQYTQAQDLIERSDGSLLLTQIRFDGFGARDIVSDVLELNARGLLLDSREIPGGDQATYVQRVTPSQNGLGYVLAGFNRDGNSDQEQFFLAAKGISEQPEVFACPDFNVDQRTDMADIMLASANWETTQGIYDMNGDGQLNVLDLTQVVNTTLVCP